MKTVTMTLCGRVCRENQSRASLTNAEKFERVTSYISDYFPANAIHFQNRESLTNEAHPYPDYYAANWVVQEEENTIKQTVIVVHGNSYVEVNRKLATLTTKINWN